MPTETERVEVDQRHVNALVEQAERAFLGALEGLARVAEAAGVPPDMRGTTVRQRPAPPC